MSEGVQIQNQIVTVNKSNESESGENDLQSILIPNQPATRKPYIEDQGILDWVTANVVGLMPQVRSNMNQIQEEWQRISRMMTMEMEEDASYKGETQVVLPTFANAVETRVAHISKASFPTDSFLDAVATKDETPEEAKNREANKAWMKKQIETYAKLRSNVKPLARNVCMYGTGVLKVWWEDKLIKQKRKHKAQDLQLEKLLMQQMESKKYKRCGKLRVKTVNNYAFYAHPLTVGDLDQCTLVFEDIQVSKQYIEVMIAHQYWKEDSIQMSSSIPETETQIQRTLNQNTQTSNSAVSGSASGSLGEYTLMSECWFNMVLPEKYFTKEEIADNEHLNPQPMRAIICGSNIVDLQDNPFNHGKYPYLMKKLIDTPDVLITPGYGKLVMTSQYFLNDLVNQLNDNGIYALNPLVLRDITKMAGHSLSQKISPGANFDITEKGALEFARPPYEQVQAGVQLLQLAKAEVTDTIAPLILQGVGSGGGGAARTATGAQVLQQNTKTDIQDFNEEMEQQVFTPLLEMAYSLGQQFETEEMFFAITGKEKVKFAPHMLSQELSWQWVASSQTINQQLRGQQMINLFQMLANPQLIQLLATQNLKVKFETLLRKIWEDGFGQRSFESLIDSVQPMLNGMMGATGVPLVGAQMPGQLSPEQVSAVSQNPNGGPPVNPVEGEGGAFRDVRDEAEGMSGLLGELGNAKKMP